MSNQPDYLSGPLRTAMILAAEGKAKEAAAEYQRYLKEVLQPKAPPPPVPKRPE